MTVEELNKKVAWLQSTWAQAQAELSPIEQVAYAGELLKEVGKKLHQAADTLEAMEKRNERLTDLICMQWDELSELGAIPSREYIQLVAVYGAPKKLELHEEVRKVAGEIAEEHQKREQAEKRAKDLLSDLQAAHTRLSEVEQDRNRVQEGKVRAEKRLQEPRGNFLWPCDIDSEDLDEQIKAHGYEVINCGTEELRKIHWDALLEAVGKKRLAGAREAWELRDPDGRFLTADTGKEQSVWGNWFLRRYEIENVRSQAITDMITNHVAQGYRAVRILIIPG